MLAAGGVLGNSGSCNSNGLGKSFGCSVFNNSCSVFNNSSNLSTWRRTFAMLSFLLLVVVAWGMTGCAHAEDAQKSAIMVTDYWVSPEVLMQGDIGTVTVTVKNMEMARSVYLKEVCMLSREIEVLSKPFLNVGRLGPGESITFTFTVRATCPDGIYYPKILVETEEAETVRYSIPVQVDSTPLTISVENVPEDIFVGERTEIKLAVGNPRLNAATGVRVVAESENIVPSEVFIGELPPDEAGVISFNFTPQMMGVCVLNFRLEFRNGDNSHSMVLNVPLNVAESKKGVELILTGIEVEATGANSFKITGDINNAGLEAARSVVMRVGTAEGVEGVHPYKAYFVGLLNPDDFSSFELHVKATGSVSEVPLVIEYKDEDGNLFSKIEYVSIGQRAVPTASSEGTHVLMVVVLVAVASVVAGAIAYSWKRK